MRDKLREGKARDAAAAFVDDLLTALEANPQQFTELYTERQLHRGDACDLYLSASSYESYSMATAEAVAHGLPIVAYATGAIGDWIEDGINGMLIAFGKPEHFFRALRRLLTERHTLNQLRHNAWARTATLALHSWDTTYRDFLQAVQQ